MKQKISFVVLALALSLSACCQVLYGTNGSNFVESLTDENIDLLLGHWPEKEPFVLRVRNDKDWPAAMPDENILRVAVLDEAMKNRGGSLVVVYTFNTRDQKTLEQNVYGWEQLQDFGIPIVPEFGNEEFADVAGHDGWDDYWSTITPLISYLQDYPGPMLFPIAPRPAGINGPKKNHIDWNNGAAVTVNQDDRFQPVFHIYGNQKDSIGVLRDLKREKLPESLNDGSYLEDKDIFFRGLVTDFVGKSEIIPQTMAYAAATFPGKELWLTEVGPIVSTGNLSNTMGYEMAWFSALAQLSSYPQVKAIMRHNGITTSWPGIINKKRRGESSLTEFIPRLGMLTYQLWFESEGRELFINTTRTDIGIEGKANFYQGANFYSSTGWCEWWATGSIVTDRVDYLQTSQGVIPALSFGYLDQGELPPTDSCKEETVMVVDTILDTTTISWPGCEKCEHMWFYMFNRKYCNRICPSSGVILVTVSFDTTYQVIEDCDTIPPPSGGIQPIDADTLHFHNETELRDWNRYHGLGDWEVLPPSFVAGTPLNQLVPYTLQKGCKDRPEDLGGDTTLLAPDPTYWHLPEGCNNRNPGWGPGQCIPTPAHWTVEELYFPLGANTTRDHHHYAKHEREMRPCYCPDADLNGVNESITNPFTGQTVMFYDIYNWSNLFGYRYYNLNKLLYQVWPDMSNHKNVTFSLNTVHQETGCDFTFREWFPGHNSMTLSFQGQRYGEKVSVADVYGPQLGRIP